MYRFEFNPVTRAAIKQFQDQMKLITPMIENARLFQITVPKLVIPVDTLRRLQEMQLSAIESSIFAKIEISESIKHALDWQQSVSDILQPSIEILKNIDFAYISTTDINVSAMESTAEEPIAVQSPEIDEDFVQTVSETLANDNMSWSIDRILMFVTIIIMLLQIAQAASSDPQLEKLIKQNETIIEKLEAIDEDLD